MKYTSRILVGFYVLILAFSSFSLSGCVWGGGREYNSADNREYNRVDRNYYRNGRWYRRNSFGFSVAVSALAIGALIESLPPRYTTVVVEGAPYYHDDRYYYQQDSRGGYVVVQPPRR